MIKTISVLWMPSQQGPDYPEIANQHHNPFLCTLDMIRLGLFPACPTVPFLEPPETWGLWIPTLGVQHSQRLPVSALVPFSAHGMRKRRAIYNIGPVCTHWKGSLVLYPPGEEETPSALTGRRVGKKTK